MAVPRNCIAAEKTHATPIEQALGQPPPATVQGQRYSVMIGLSSAWPS